MRTSRRIPKNNIGRDYGEIEFTLTYHRPNGSSTGCVTNEALAAYGSDLSNGARETYIRNHLNAGCVPCAVKFFQEHPEYKRGITFRNARRALQSAARHSNGGGKKVGGGHPTKIYKR